MQNSFVAYIDESGDEGFKFLPDGSGSTRWFVLSALVLRKENDHHVVSTAKKIRELLGKKDKFPLHFRNLPHDQRVALTQVLGQMPSRTISILIHKPSITEPENFQREPYSLYRYASRLLLERISWLCRDAGSKNGNGMVDLIYSNRSAMSYEELRSYLNLLKDQSTNKDIKIDWSIIHPDNVRAVNHEKLAGLQLADAIATSAFYAVTPNKFGNTEERYLRNLSKIIYRHDRKMEGYGIKLWCCDKEIHAKAVQLLESP